MRFAEFELDLRAQELRKDGRPVHLQPQPFRVLSLLLERPGELVTREEFQRQLWPEDVFVDFDRGLTRCINKLREVLGDSAESPRFIETLPRRGYRFIAPMEAVQAAQEPAAPANRFAEGFSSRVQRPTLVALCLVLLITLARVAFLGVGYIPRKSKPLPARRTWILVVPFENHTGESALDGLEYLVARDLSESRFFIVVPPERTWDALRLMRRPPDTRLDPVLAREVAARDGGIETLITGRVEKVGTTYVVQAWGINPYDAAVRGTAMGEAATAENLVPAVRTVVDKLRTELGEPEAPATSQTGSAHLEKVTTPSLRSLQLYTAANARIRTDDGKGAVALLEEALRLDPDFASGHILLAHALSNIGRDKEAGPHYVRALELANTATERERYFIVGSYYDRYAHDQERARRSYETLLELYPDDYWTYGNLSQIYRSQGLEERAVELIIRRADLRPRDFDSNYRAMSRCADSGNRACADRYRNRATALITPEWERELPDETLEVEFFPIEQLIINGNNEAALSALQRQELMFDARDFRVRDVTAQDLAYDYRCLGRLRQAQTWSRRISTRWAREAAEWQIAEAQGDRVAMKQALLRQVALGVAGWNGVVHLAMVGKSREARTRLERFVALMGVTKTKASTPGYQMAVGGMALAEHSPAEAIEWLEKARLGFRRGDTRFLPINALLLAQAHEAAGHPERAIRVLAEEETDGYSSAVGMDSVAQARLHLWQLYVASGQKSEADAIAAKLRQQLSVADPDHPILRALNERSGMASNKRQTNLASTAR